LNKSFVIQIICLHLNIINQNKNEMTNFQTVISEQGVDSPRVKFLYATAVRMGHLKLVSQMRADLERIGLSPSQGMYSDAETAMEIIQSYPIK
jgi:hypothetical protein